MVCPYCGASVSEQADKCEYCGGYIDNPIRDMRRQNEETQKRFSKIFIAIIVMVFIIFLFIMGFMIVTSFSVFSIMKDTMSLFRFGG